MDTGLEKKAVADDNNNSKGQYLMIYLLPLSKGYVTQSYLIYMVSQDVCTKASPMSYITEIALG